MLILKKLILIVVVYFFSAFLIGKILDYRFKERWKYWYTEKLDTVVSGNENYDVVFLGNSQIHLGINPYYFDSVTGFKSYNLGIGGANAATTNMIASAYAGTHAPPKYLFISKSISQFLKYDVFKTDYYYYYYLSNDSMKKHSRDYKIPSTLIVTFPFLKYAFFNEYYRSTLFAPDRSTKFFGKNSYKGFINIYPEKTKLLQGGIGNVVEATISSYDFSLVKKMENFLRIFNKTGAKCYFVQAPRLDYLMPNFKETELDKKGDSIFNLLSLKYKIPIINFKYCKNFTSDDFIDMGHLNEPATQKFSKMLADSLLSRL